MAIHRMQWCCWGWGGGGVRYVEGRRPPLNFKSHCHFQYESTKIESILKVIH